MKETESEIISDNENKLNNIQNDNDTNQLVLPKI